MSGTALSTWSTTAANNNDAGGLWPEGQTRSSVNNSAREMQAEIRTFYNDPNWVIYGDGDEEATVAYASANSFTVAGVDVTDVYNTGRRVRATGSSTGDIRGTITGSSFSTDTTVTVDWDEGDDLSNEAIVIYLSAIPQRLHPLPRVALQKPNILPNGEFLVWQNGTTITAASTVTNDDDTYMADGCVLLSDGNDVVDVSQNTGLTTRGYGYAICLLDVETANKKFGLLFPVESIEAAQLFGKQASISFKARDDGSNTTLETIRVGLLEWTGTADSITSDVVSSWGTAGNNPTLATNWAYANTPFSITLSTTLREYRLNNIAVSSSATNVAVFIWVDDTDATVTDKIYIGDVNLVEGEVATPIMRQSFGEAQRRCQRYFCKTFPHTQVPVANTGVEGSLSGRGDSTGAFLMQWRFPVEMRVAPTISTYNPSVAATNTARNLDDSTNTTPNAQAIGTMGATITHDSVDATDANDRMIVHAAATARL